MQVGQFPASAANSLIEGYCSDFVSLAAILAQTLEQVSMRGIAFDESRAALERIERGMRELASAIEELLERGQVTTQFESVLGESQNRTQPTPDATLPTAPSWNQDGPTRGAPASRPAPQRGLSRAPQPPPRQAQPQAKPAQFASAPRAPGPTPTHQPVHAINPPPAAPRQPTNPTAAKRAANEATGTLRGTNESMPVLSVFQFLGRMRKTGTMHVFHAGESLAFEFVNGCVQFTASDRCPVNERLGELLIELQFCTRDTLAPALAKVGVTSPDRLGQLVVRQGIVTNGQVLEALEEQVHRRFHRICNSRDASYEFEEGVCVPGDGRIRITPMELVYERQRSDRSSPPQPNVAQRSRR